MREVCARVWGTMAVPHVVMRDGHCGPARLLPIIMTNEGTEAVSHSTASAGPPSQDAGVTSAAPAGAATALRSDGATRFRSMSRVSRMVR